MDVTGCPYHPGPLPDAPRSWCSTVQPSTNRDPVQNRGYLRGVPKSPRRKPKHEARIPAQGQSSAAGALRRTGDWMPSEGHNTGLGLTNGTKSSEHTATARMYIMMYCLFTRNCGGNDAHLSITIQLHLSIMYTGLACTNLGRKLQTSHSGAPVLTVRGFKAQG